ncbi:hypothetical protein EBOKLHFM_00006 [Klebsiella phage KP13-26]|uniref:Uncharacterized protein n=1 Tax=Klebsiella phage FKP3 TaxID=3231233 RepID=A0AAU8HZX1_9CAUD|nr:hypothetical protein EBOKLHFM_00006 [Klebsiella phage KP13-26]
MITTSDTIVMLYTWETSANHCQARSVPLPHALRMLDGGFYRVKVVAENGEVLADTLYN